jgi:hypothetical protein
MPNRVAPNIYFNAKYPQTLGRYKGNLIHTRTLLATSNVGKQNPCSPDF